MKIVKEKKVKTRKRLVFLSNIWHQNTCKKPQVHVIYAPVNYYSHVRVGPRSITFPILSNTAIWSSFLPRIHQSFVNSSAKSSHVGNRMIFTNISSMTIISTRIHEINHYCLLIQINRLYNFVIFSSQRTHNYD